MKRFFTNSVLFMALAVGFSGFTACTNTTVQNENSQAPKNTQNNNYPPVPSAIAQTEIKDLDGNTFKIEDKKGKVLLVNLWAIWCGPCVAEMPEFVKLQDEYRDKGFEVIGLNTGDYEGQDEPAENIKRFVEQKNINYLIAYGDDKIYGGFDKITRTGGIPQSMVINREGQMTFIGGGGGSRIINQIKEAVEKAVNE
jgi:thiol-disulfide isomerase/thioredoxin